MSVEPQYKSRLQRVAPPSEINPFISILQSCVAAYLYAPTTNTGSVPRQLSLEECQSWFHFHDVLAEDPHGIDPKPCQPPPQHQEGNVLLCQQLVAEAGAPFLVVKCNHPLLEKLVSAESCQGPYAAPLFDTVTIVSSAKVLEVYCIHIDGTEHLLSTLTCSPLSSPVPLFRAEIPFSNPSYTNILRGMVGYKIKFFGRKNRSELLMALHSVRLSSCAPALLTRYIEWADKGLSFEEATAGQQGGGGMSQMGAPRQASAGPEVNSNDIYAAILSNLQANIDSAIRGSEKRTLQALQSLEQRVVMIEDRVGRLESQRRQPM